jgi:hypothetical protein
VAIWITQQSQSRDHAIVQCLRIFAQHGRKIRLQSESDTHNCVDLDGGSAEGKISTDAHPTDVILRLVKIDPFNF